MKLQRLDITSNALNYLNTKRWQHKMHFDKRRRVRARRRQRQHRPLTAQHEKGYNNDTFSCCIEFACSRKTLPGSNAKASVKVAVCRINSIQYVCHYIMALIGSGKRQKEGISTAYIYMLFTNVLKNSNIQSR